MNSRSESSDKTAVSATCAGSSSFDPSRVPIVSLAGIACLSDVLLELPMPTPYPEVVGGPTQTLYFHQRVAEEAQKYVNSVDPNLVSVVTTLLSSTNADHVVIKNEFRETDMKAKSVSEEILSENSRAPALLKNVLAMNPGTFDPHRNTGEIGEPDFTPTGPTSSDLRSTDSSDSIPDHLKHLFSQEPIIEVEQMDISRNGANSAGASRSTGSASESMKKRIVSIGKQPKGQPYLSSASSSAANKKKRTMVSELFDSLTPAAEYFADGSRRRRTGPKTYDEFEAVVAAQDSLEQCQQQDSTSGETSSVYQSCLQETVGEQGENGWQGKPFTSRKRSHKISKSRHGRIGGNDGSNEHQPESERPLTPNEVIKEREEHWQEIMKKRRDKRRRRYERSGGVYQMIDPDELVENESYRKFCAAIDTVFDNAEDVDLSAETADDEDEIPAECLIPKHIMMELCSEANKLKILGATNRVPVDRLTKLITVLEKNVKDGAKSVPFIDEKSEADETASWREAMTDRVLRSADAALVALTVMTSPSMPKQVFIEDTIELSVSFVKFQLQNVIFPAYDPLYRAGKDKTGPAPDADADNSSNPKQHKRSRASSAVLKNKTLLCLYGKISELIGCFADLVEAQMLTDTTVLQLSSLGVTPFFVEGIGELQLHALRLVANIFARYEKHRKLILEDILASLARLPSTKRGMRTYRLSTEEYIQMVSALVMRLVQSVVQVPSSAPKTMPSNDYEEGHNDRGNVAVQDADVVINTSYDCAMRTAHTFLTAYLKKCTTKSEEDYRPLFEAFVEDLLTAVHKPDWPAAELLLSLLGNLLVQYFSNKQIEMPLRVASLDYLGVVASRLRKDAVGSQLDDAQLQRILRTLTESGREDGEEDVIIAGAGALETKRIKIRFGGRRQAVANLDKMQTLQKALVEYLREQRENDSTIEFSKTFYIAQWYKDCTSLTGKQKAKGVDENKPCEHHDDGVKDVMEQEQLDALAQKIAAKKQFLLSLNEAEPDLDYGAKLRRENCLLSEQEAAFVVRYLASKRPLSQSFDIYLAHILRVLNETAVAVRTKAMKCLSLVVEADPTVLGRADIQHAVHARLLDQSSSVREAAVDLIGKFICAQPDFIDKYYKMIIERILDTGVSVRKRVIKILKDICERRPDLNEIPEICVRILRRANDEESVRKLVVETFHGLWFLPVKERETATLLKKVMTIIDVIAAYGHDISCQYDGFEALLAALLKKDAACEKGTLLAARQIVNCLVENVLTLEEKMTDTGGRSGGHSRLLSCMTTLYLFSKVCPPLLVPHAETLQPYLLMNCNTRNEQTVLVNVVRILEMVVPLMEHPSPGFLSEVEDSLIRLATKHGPQIIQACISCLSAVVNGLTKNVQLIQTQFFKLFNTLLKIKNEMESKLPSSGVPGDMKPTLLRTLFTLGLLCRYFDLDEAYPEDKKPEVLWRDQVFRAFMFFTGSIEEDVKLKALAALGALCIKHPDFMIQNELKQRYCSHLRRNELSSSRAVVESDERLKCQVLRNIEQFLKEEEAKLMRSNEEWNNAKMAEDLKELGESASGLGSSVIQHYLQEVEQCYFHPQTAVRGAVCEVVVLTLQQGLVHPAQCIPHVIAMQTDSELSIRVKADKILKEVETKYPGFVQTKAVEGVRLSFRLQQVLCKCQGDKSHQPNQNANVRQGKLRQQPPLPMLLSGPRGLRSDQTSGLQALNSQLYSLLRSGRTQRRAFLRGLLQLFDENSKTSLEEMIYVVDNLASFPYQILEEPLFICHHVDIAVSVTGASVVQAFHEGLLRKPKADPLVVLNPGDIVQMQSTAMGYSGSAVSADLNTSTGSKRDDDDDDDDDEELTIEELLNRLPSDCGPLEQCMTDGQGCLMLLSLKQYLKDMFGITDSKLQEYSPTESAKAHDKALNRRPSAAPFQPRFFSIGNSPTSTGDLERRYQLCQQFLEFKQLTMSIDAANAGYASDEDAGPVGHEAAPMGESGANAVHPKKRMSKGLGRP